MPSSMARALLFLALFLAVPAYATQALKVGVYQNRPHVFIDKNGSPRGLFIDLLNHIAKQEGWQLEYMSGSWAQCLTRLQNGEIELLPAVSYSDSRAQRYAFGEVTVIVNWATIYAKSRSGIETVMALRNRKIAVVQGDMSYDALRRMLERFAVPCEFAEVEGFPEAMELVKNGGADAGLVGRLFGTQHEKDYGLEATPILCSPMQLRFAAPDGSTNAVRALDRHIVTMKRDKQSAYYKAMTKWILPLEEWEFPAWAAMGLAGIAVLVVFLSGAGFFLRLQVRKRTAELARANEGLRAEIAERTRVEASLRESERRFRGLFERTFGFLGLLAPDGTVLELNQPALDFTGLRHDAVVGRPLWETGWSAPSDDAKARLKAAILRAASGDFVRYEVEMVGKRNRKETLDFSVKPIRNESGDITMLIAEARNISQIKKTRQMLLQYQEDLRALTLKLPLAEEQERKRLAAALHDSVIQSLSLSRIKLGSLKKQISSPEAQELLRDLRKMFDTALRQIRTLTFELSPPVLYELGLAAAIEWLGDELVKKNKRISFEFERVEDPPGMDEVVKILLFQSVRELLHNAAKHSKARHVDVAMESRNGRIDIEVADDGRGFDVELVSGHAHTGRNFGLFSIRERMRQIGGSLEVKSKPGEGTTAVLDAPLQAAARKGEHHAN